LQELFDVSNFRGLKFCVMRGARGAFSIDDDFRSHDLLSPEGMVAGWASTVTDTDAVFKPGACGTDDGLAAVWAIDWHLCFEGVNGREMDQPLQLPCFPLLRVLYAVRLPGPLQRLLGPSQSVQEAKTA